MRREDGRTEPENCLAQRAATWVEKDMAEVELSEEAREKAACGKSGGIRNRAR